MNDFTSASIPATAPTEAAPAVKVIPFMKKIDGFRIRYNPLSRMTKYARMLYKSLIEYL